MATYARDVPTYTNSVWGGVFPNGQAVVRESTLGAHIQAAGPWRARAETTGRPVEVEPRHDKPTALHQPE